MYNRRFLKPAAHTYPIPRDGEVEEQLTERYLASLLPGKIKERCINHDPRLVYLNTATDVASSEWGKERRRVRISLTSFYRCRFDIKRNQMSFW